MPSLRLLVLLTLILAPGGAVAACLDATSIDRGVQFLRADGTSGHAVRDGAAIRLDYAVGVAQRTDERLAKLGIYDQTGVVFRPDLPEGAVMVGAGALHYTWKHASTPPIPQAGQTWASTIRETTSEDMGLESGPERRRRSYTVSYRFLAAREVTLSGCTYASIPVEADYAAPDTRFSRRWAWFPDLGFALETRSNDPRGHAGADRKLGLTALTPAG